MTDSPLEPVSLPETDAGGKPQTLSPTTKCVFFKKRTIIKFIRNYGTPTAILLGALLIAGSIYISFGIPNQKLAQKLNSPESTLQELAPNKDNTEAEKTNVSPDDDAFLGNENAPVTVIEFSDFQCFFCRSFWRETLPLLKSNYIATGKVKFVYRDFPLGSIHPGAEAAAEAAECAKEQGKFWEMHDKIFSKQDEESQGTVKFGKEELKLWAAEAGLKKTQFGTCLDSGKFQAEVKKDLEDGLASKVDATPFFFVNGKVIRGALPYEVFAQAIEEELAGE